MNPGDMVNEQGCALLAHTARLVLVMLWTRRRVVGRKARELESEEPPLRLEPSPSKTPSTRQSGTRSTATTRRPAIHLLHLSVMTTRTPPPAFALVQPLLYRSSTFSSTHFPFISALHLRTIVSLGPELPSRALQLWCEPNSVRFVHLGNKRSVATETRDWRPVQEELIKEALEFVLEKDNLPCLVMDP